jgi:hypothetical protein
VQSGRGRTHVIAATQAACGCLFLQDLSFPIFLLLLEILLRVGSDLRERSRFDLWWNTHKRSVNHPNVCPRRGLIVGTRAQHYYHGACAARRRELAQAWRRHKPAQNVTRWAMCFQFLPLSLSPWMNAACSTAVHLPVHSSLIAVLRTRPTEKIATGPLTYNRAPRRALPIAMWGCSIVLLSFHPLSRRVGFGIRFHRRFSVLSSICLD